MAAKIPRIASVGIGDELYAGRRALVVTWAAEPARSSEIDLSGWIRTGSETLAPLKDKALFRTAAVSEFRDAVYWGGDEDGDLAIDALHLSLLAEQQKPMSADEVAAWQAKERLSNAEAADFFGVAPSTWARYKTGAAVPAAVSIAIRAAKRDPLILRARLRPVAIGRPRMTA